MATRKRQQTGRYGETLAAQHLQTKNYRLIARNWRCPVGEIDLIARDGDTLVFVEVRTRHGERLGTPEESITPRKQARLIELAQTYLSEHNAFDQPWRIDVIAIALDQQQRVRRLTHLPNAIEAQI